MTLIVVEGVDGSGKSTLIAEMSHLLDHDTRVKHRGPLKKHPLIEYVGDLASYTPNDTILCDRWHVGELVYGPLYRGSSQVTPAMKRYIELFLISRGALRLIMDTPFEVVKERLAARGEDFLQPEHLHLVHDFYLDYASTERWNLMRYVYDVDDVRTVLRNAKAAAKLVAPLTDFPSYVGHLKPTVLLVADYEGESPFPTAAPPLHGSRGHYLLTALEAAQVTFTYGIVNAGWHLPPLLEILGHPRVMTLTRTASDKCRRTGVAHTALGDPLALRSIPFAYFSGYGEKLQEVVDDGA